MDLTEARSLMIAKMQLHGLIAQGWQFQWDNAQKRHGYCSYDTKTISLSRVLTPLLDDETVEQTMLHEIAHALVGANDRFGRSIGHGQIWKDKAYEIGYRGSRTAAVVENLADGKTFADLPSSYHRKPRVQRPDEPAVDQWGSPTATPGQWLTFPSKQGGQITGQIIKMGRSRYHVREHGRAEGLWTVAFGWAKIVDPPEGQTVPDLTKPSWERGLVNPANLTPVAVEPTNHRYTIEAPYALNFGRGLNDVRGRGCTIVKTGPKNHHVQIDAMPQGTLLVIPRQFVIRNES